MTAPFRPIPRLVRGNERHVLLRRVLGMGVPDGTRRVDLVTTSTLRVTLHDTGPDGYRAAADGDTAIQCLWQRNESTARLLIDDVPADAFAPGDIVTIPGGDHWEVSREQITLEIATPMHALAIPCGPTHGEEAFHGFNRKTTYPPTGSQYMSRWKITQPLDLMAGRETIIINLATPPVLLWHGGSEPLPRGDCRVVTDPVTILPDGLAYVFVIERQ